ARQRIRSFSLRMTASALLDSRRLHDCACVVSSEWVSVPPQVPGDLRDAIAAADAHAWAASAGDDPVWSDIEHGLRAAADIFDPPGEAAEPDPAGTARLGVEQVAPELSERLLGTALLAQNPEWSGSQLASALGISRATLYRRDWFRGARKA